MAKTPRIPKRRSVLGDVLDSFTLFPKPPKIKLGSLEDDAEAIKSDFDKIFKAN